MNVDLGLKLDKKDVLTIAILCIVFFSIAAVNLGYTTYPTTNLQVTAGQGFYLNLGNQTNVKSMLILLHLGVFNVTVYSGTPSNWTLVTNSIEPPLSNGQFSEDYSKYYEITLDQTTQYLMVQIGYAPSYYGTSIAQVAVVNQDNQIVTLNSTSITNDGTPSLPVADLVNAQSSVHYPIDYMENTYFDEIYFVRTAQEYLHLQPAYEWTHPPLGKLVQAAGILVFGFNPFGWRIMGVIFATLMVALIYLVGKKLLNSWIGGFTAAFMLTFDFMHFTMARMGTADTYVVFFSLASQLFFLIYLKNVLDKGWKTSVIPLFLAVMFAVLGASTKWLVLFGFAGALVLLVIMRLGDVRKIKGKISDKIFGFLDHPYSVLVGFLLLGILVYFISFIPAMLSGTSFTGVLNLQEQMWIYQSTLKATHPFQSLWYTWPLMFNPFTSAYYGGHVVLWLQEAYLLNGQVSTISLLGNPALWWTGFAIIAGLTISYVPKFFSKKFDLKANVAVVFILVYFFFQWLPYIFITRITFIYHFYSNVPFLCLAVAFMVDRYWSSKYMKIIAIAYFALTIALFVMFYPVISGVPTTIPTINSLTWIKSWTLGP